jgi:hypothetical protein
MLGVGIVLKTTGPGQKFYDLLSSIKTWVPPLRESVILNSIESSMKGKFGRQNVHAKTNDKKPWISPLTCMYWYFEAEAVAKMKYFYDGAVKSDTVKDVADALQEYRDNNAIDSFLKIPI